MLCIIPLPNTNKKVTYGKHGNRTRLASVSKLIKERRAARSEKRARPPTPEPDLRFNESKKFGPKKDDLDWMDNQSGERSVMQISSDTTSQNVAFADQHQPYMESVDTFVDPTRTMQDASDADLGSFFSRPIKIASINWDTSSGLYQRIDPWSLYFNNPRVANRLTNFNLLRASLKVKIVINGNGFLFGRAMACYQPFDQLDQLTENDPSDRTILTQFSQWPKVFLDPTTSTGGELSLPFFWFANYMSIPESDWGLMGALHFIHLNTLEHANDSTGTVTISVFAWAEDVSFNMLTSVDTDTLGPQSSVGFQSAAVYENQSGEIDTANTKGIVSGPATALSKAAGALSAIPQIAPFAMATSRVAAGVSAMAKVLGYCRPPVTKNPEPFREFPTSSLALTNVPDNAQKLTVDEKQELTIDPRIAGVGPGDPLDIANIASRESYLTSFDWAQTIPAETLLWNVRVNPTLWTQSPAEASTRLSFPACAVAAMPFRHWNGTMKFRFQIVCSAFHKGRIKVVYDPNWLASNEYNTNYLKVIDIADTTDFTIEIGNGQKFSLLSRLIPGRNSQTECFSTTAFASANPGNGVLGVYVVNQLTTPNSTGQTPIQVNVFVSCDNFEGFVPISEFQQYEFKEGVIEAGLEVLEMDNQSGAIVPDSQNTQELNAPEQTITMTLGNGDTDHPDVNKVFAGERVKSFRTLLKRYALHSSIWCGPNVGTEISDTDVVRLNLSRDLYPYLRGYVSGAKHETTNQDQYNFCNTLLFHIIDRCFSGRRGGMRYKLVPRVQGRDVNFTGTIERSNEETLNQNVWSDFVNVDTNPPNNINTVANSCMQRSFNNNNIENNTPAPGAMGSVYVNSRIQPNAEFEIPYQSWFRFYPGKPENTQGTSTLQGNRWQARYFFTGIDTTPPNSDNTAPPILDQYCAVAEDYTPYFWTGLPPVYILDSTPNPLPLESPPLGSF